MNPTNYLIVFTLDGQRYAVNLFYIERVIPTVELTPLPKAPDIVSGIFNLQGRIIPVVNIRKRFRLPEREINANDHLIVAHTMKRAVGFVVDAVLGTCEYSEVDVISSNQIVPGIGYIEGVVKISDDIILIHNLDTFLSLEEEGLLKSAMEEMCTVEQNV